MSKKAILITGGTGFIGSYLCESLLEQGHQLTLVCKNYSYKNIQKYLEHKSLQIVHEDLSGDVNFDQLLQDIDIVIHLYWNSIPRKEIQSLHLDLNNSLRSSLQLIEACVKHKIEKFIFPSSGGTVYGVKEAFPIKEEEILLPISYYGLTKSLFEKYLHYYYSRDGLEYVILRLSNVYGPKQNLKVSQGVISHWLKGIMLNNQITLYGKGNIIRDYIYVTDVINAFTKVIFGKTTSKVYNISSSQGVELLDLIHIFRDDMNLDFKINKIPAYKTDLKVNILSNLKAQKELNWCPIINLKEGIRHTFNYLNEKVQQT